MTIVPGSLGAMARLKLEKPPGDGIKTLLRKELSQVLKQLAAARAGAKVHGARRGIKVARSTLRLARPALASVDFATADHALRQAAGLLAGTRHREALAETIARLGPHPLFDALLAPPADPATSTSAGDAPAAADTLVADVRKSLRHWAMPRRDIAPFVAGMAACYRKARNALRRGFASGETGQLHQARKSVIHHLHHLEALASLWPAVFKVWVQELNNLRLALGDLNDLDELERALAGVQDAEVTDRVAARRAALIAAAAHAAGPLFAEKPKAFAARMEAMWRRATD